jgi:hypothetical protein
MVKDALGDSSLGLGESPQHLFRISNDPDGSLLAASVEYGPRGLND